MKSLQSEILDLTADAPTRFRQIAQSHPLWCHPFVERCRAGRLTLAQVRVLGEILWDELGDGDQERPHAAVFRRFTRALGTADAQLAAVPAQPETSALINTYLNLSKRYGVLGILGALCYASEGIVAALYTHIQGGLLQAVALDKEALLFFELHIHVDNGHADKLESVLLPMLRTPQDELLVEQAIQTALDARCRFFDGVLREAERHAAPALAGSA
jgi:pyrroloquinoline-quinone synthase